MKPHKKTVIGSIATLILGTSCCSLSSLAIWFGGIAFIQVIINFIESVQLQLLLLSMILGIISIYLKNKR